MNWPYWHWNGTLDLFGTQAARIQALLEACWREARETGGELQIAPQANGPLATQRVSFYAHWSSTASPLTAYLARLAQELPSDHPPMTLQGHEEPGGQRMDLILKGGRLLARPYHLVAGEPVALDEFSE